MGMHGTASHSARYLAPPRLPHVCPYSTSCSLDELNSVSLSHGSSYISSVITDVPTENDYTDAAVRFLNLGWESAVSVLEEEDALDSTGVLEPAELEEHNTRAQHSLAMGLALVQQGVELLLKAGIARVSPFILISKEHQKWSSLDDSGNISFSKFRTLDAQDLPKVYSAAVGILPEEFVQAYDRMCQLRNTIFHSIGVGERFAAKDVIEWILQSSNLASSQIDWIDARKRFVSSSSQEYTYSYLGDCRDTVERRVANEIKLAAHALSQSKSVELLGIDRTRRFYICPGCRWGDLDEQCKITQLRPPTPSSTTVWCHACQREFPVVRKDCIGDCLGNVISATEYDEERCLTCDMSQV